MLFGGGERGMLGNMRKLPLAPVDVGLAGLADDTG